MPYHVKIPGIPILLNDILRTKSQHQSRLKARGKKNKLGYIQLEEHFRNLPRFKKPVSITLTIYQTRQYPIDIDSCNKTLLDALKFYKIIIDDNEKGIKSYKVVYAKGYHKQKTLKLSFYE